MANPKSGPDYSVSNTKQFFFQLHKTRKMFSRTPGWRPLSVQSVSELNTYVVFGVLSSGTINSKLNKLHGKQHGQVPLTNADGRSASRENQLVRLVDSVHVKSS
jgi:hypothetical protein